MADSTNEALIDEIKRRLSLDVRETDSYNGGMSDGPMYDRVVTLRLLFDDEVISEVTL